MSSVEKPARYGRSRFAIACAALRLVEIQACKRPLVYRGMALRPYAATIGGTDSYVIEFSDDIAASEFGSCPPREIARIEFSANNSNDSTF
jgi:hypothetical protein